MVSLKSVACACYRTVHSTTHTSLLSHTLLFSVSCVHQANPTLTCTQGILHTKGMLQNIVVLQLAVMKPEAYEMIAEHLFKSGAKRDIVNHVMFLLDWKLMKRSENCLNVKMKNWRTVRR